jgi:YVTN family beta-propeller protein
MPHGRSLTQIVVASPTGPAPAKPFRLTGNFEPEAFSTNGDVLFMLDFFPALAPERYQVARLDLRTGNVSPAFGAVKGPAPKMSGTRIMHVLSPDHSTLYTLYTNQDPSYSGAWGKGEVAFVHTLSLGFGQAVCIDLPDEFGPGSSSAKTLALSPDGSRLYAVDSAAGLVSVIDTAKRRVIETKKVSFESGEDPAYATTGSNGTLYVGSGQQVTVIDPETMAIEHRWNVEAPINGLGLGEHLFVAVPNRILELDASTGTQIASFQASGVQGISYVPPSA